MDRIIPLIWYIRLREVFDMKIVQLDNSKLIFRAILISFCALLLIAFQSVSAKKQTGTNFIIHVTQGGPLTPIFLGAPGRLPKLTDDIATPIKPGTVDELDCEYIANLDYDQDGEPGDLLITTEAGALCNAIAQLQRHLRNDATIEVEFYFADLTAISPSAIGAAGGNPNIVVSSNPNDPRAAYNEILRLVKKQNNMEGPRSDKIVNFLPKREKLQVQLPPDLFYDDWKPATIGLTQAQVKALGGLTKKLKFEIPPGEDIILGLVANPQVDFFFLLADTSAASSALEFDFNLADSTGMQGPLELETYNAIDFTDPLCIGTTIGPDGNAVSPAGCSWPLGFNLAEPKRFIDIQGVVMHELMHGLGYLSNIGGPSFDLDFGLPSNAITSPASLDLVEERFHRAALLDLYRVQDDTAVNIKKYKQFREAARYWTVDDLDDDISGINNFCRVEDGTAVVVTDIVNKQAKRVLMSSGSFFKPVENPLIPGRMDGFDDGLPGDCVKGDCQQSAHARNPFQAVPVEGSELEACTVGGGGPVVSGAVQGHHFIPDQEGQSPSGMIMRPFSGFHNPLLLTERDLTILDLVGWDVDYEGNQATLLGDVEPVFGNNIVSETLVDD